MKNVKCQLTVFLKTNYESLCVDFAPLWCVIPGTQIRLALGTFLQVAFILHIRSCSFFLPFVLARAARPMCIQGGSEQRRFCAPHIWPTYHRGRVKHDWQLLGLFGLSEIEHAFLFCFKYMKKRIFIQYKPNLLAIRPLCNFSFFSFVFKFIFLFGVMKIVLGIYLAI